MIGYKAKACSIIILICSLFVLTACVTESTDGKPARVIDKKESLKIHLQLVKGYVDKKNRESARHHIRKAMEIDKTSAEVLGALALVYQLEGENKLAEETFEKAIKKDKSASTIHNNYGFFLFGLKRYEEALKQFEAAAANLLMFPLFFLSTAAVFDVSLVFSIILVPFNIIVFSAFVAIVNLFLLLY